MRPALSRGINLATVALLLGAGIALIAEDPNLLEICMQSDSAFYGRECPDESVQHGASRRIAGDTTLDRDHHGSLWIVADGVTLNCAGHSVVGPGQRGISVSSHRNVSITNCNVIGFDVGLDVTEAVGVELINNTTHASGSAINVTRSSRVEIRSHTTNLDRWTVSLNEAHDNLITGTTIERGRLWIWSNASNRNRIEANNFRLEAWVNIMGTGNVVANNVFEGGGSIDDRGSGTVIESNTFHDGVGYGIGSAESVGANLANLIVWLLVVGVVLLGIWAGSGRTRSENLA